MKRRPMALSPLKRLKGATRTELHRQLDTMLDGPSTMPDGSPGTVLNDIVARQLVGYGFSVSIAVRHPNEAGRVEEAPEVTADLATTPNLVVLP